MIFVASVCARYKLPGSLSLSYVWPIGRITNMAFWSFTILSVVRIPFIDGKMIFKSTPVPYCVNEMPFVNSDGYSFVDGRFNRVPLLSVIIWLKEKVFVFTGK